MMVICILGGLASLLHAQGPGTKETPRPAVPTGPLLNRAPDFAQWTITSKTFVAPTNPGQSDGANKPSPSPTPSGTVSAEKEKPRVTDQITTIIKTKATRFEQTVTGGTQKIQRWCFPDMQVTIQGSAAPVVAVAAGSVRGNSTYTDYSKSDFGGFEWISARNFTGVEKTMGRDCLIFRDKMQTDGESVYNGTPPVTVACIDADSRLPVALQLGEEIRTYTFGQPPADSLIVPPEVSAVVEKWRKTMRQSALMPGKP